jgi:hypothetical protein
MSSGKWAKTIGFLIVLLAASTGMSAEYPNELDGFKLFAKYCPGLEPMKSTVDDVKKVLGEPLKDKSEKFVLWFEKDGWQILVYIYPDNGEYPSHLAGKVVGSIDFISIKPVSFAAVKFPKAFNKADIRAADARWDEYYDAFGLVYEVYASKPPYGDKGPGDLNRVSYRPAPHKVIQMQSFRIRNLNDAVKAKSPQH